MKTRKVERRKKGIRTTRRAPKWRRNWTAAYKGFIRSAKTILTAIGLVTVLILVLRMLGGG